MFPMSKIYNRFRKYGKILVKPIKNESRFKMNAVTIPRRDKVRIQLMTAVREEEHVHKDIELFFVLKGLVKIVVNDCLTVLEKNQAYIVNSNTKHSVVANEGSLLLRVLIDYKMIQDIVSTDSFSFEYDVKNKHGVARFQQAVDRLLNYYLENKHIKSNSFGYLSIIYHVLDILASEFLNRKIDEELNAEIDKFEKRNIELLDYIHLNYDQPITLDILASQFFLSTSYLSRFFKKQFGQNFKGYLLKLRLEKAYESVLYTDKSVTTIALENGFTNASTFKTRFQNRYGISVKELRQQVTIKEPENVILSSETLEDIQAYLQSEEDCKEQEELIFCSLSSCQPLQKSWLDMINVGPATKLLEAEMQHHILELQSQLGFEYIRIWNIFSKDLLIDFERSTGEYNFSKLKLVFDFLVKHQIRPHIELLNKPQIVSKNTSDSLQFHSADLQLSAPVFGRLFENFLKTCVVRYGLSEVEKWRFEFSYGGQLSGKNLANYFDWFNKAAKVCRGYSERIKIGGFGFNTVDTISISQRLLEMWQKNLYQPDFVTMTHYAYKISVEDRSTFTIKDRDEHSLRNMIQNVREVLEMIGWGDKILYLSEWNFTISDRNYINDTAFKGCYILENVLSNMDSLDSLAYYSASDQISEYFDTTHLLFGGMGLISRDGIFKPAAYAYRFLNQLDGYIIAKTENYIITTDRNDNYTIIYHNKKRLSDIYFNTEEHKIDLTCMEHYYTDNQSKQFQLSMADVSSGQYLVKIKRISPTNGSLLKEWSDMKFYEKLSLNDIDYFRHITIPKQELEEVTVMDNHLELGVTLEANEFVLIKIKRQ